MKPIERSQNVEAAGTLHRAIKGVVDAYELALSSLASEVEQLRAQVAAKDAELAVRREQVERMEKERAAMKDVAKP
jgi:chromosome segregation ATPase